MIYIHEYICIYVYLLATSEKNIMSGTNSALKMLDELIGIVTKKFRKLHPYEILLSYSGVVNMVILEGKFNFNDLENAFKLARKEHPYLRMGIKDTEFIETYAKLKDIITVNVMSTKEINDSWKSNIIDCGDKMYDNEKSVIYFELYSNHENDYHALYAIINHAGIFVCVCVVNV